MHRNWSTFVGIRSTSNTRSSTSVLKNGSPATHPLTGKELRALRRLQREQKTKSPFVFTSERGTPFTKRGFQAMVERAGEAARFDMKIHPHMLRHACGFKLANDGVDTRTIQAYLGHKSIQHTVRYTELSPTRFKNLSGTQLLRNLAQKAFFSNNKGDPTPMTPIEGGARKRCVKHPSTSLRLSSAGPQNTSPKKFAAPVICYLF